ncbi:hypothetical protein P261_02457 [Lachnospiraceae bacterium TWA4]|nr:hypothetical protein P261_02457 [Lachnospiraceae bacterium TWA4]
MISETAIEDADKEESKDQREEAENMKTQLTYLGQASIKIVTPENKVIYIDPYAGDDYEMSADLILVTHEHFDHNDIDCVQNRSSDCQIITEREAISNGVHQTFEFDFVTVQSVEAGYNRMHSVRNCVGYVLTMSDGVKVYVTGDTSKTKQMEEMADMEIDYAFYCQDGVYNMGMEEAAECARLVGAKHNIPYHNDTSNSGEMFDFKKAEKFDVENLLIIQPGETIELSKE